jgi:hypothetical protein
MKRRRVLVLLVAVMSLLLTAALPATATPAQKTDGFEAFSNGSAHVHGTPTLLRNSSGVSLNLKVTGLEPGFVYSVWWIVTEPEGNCDPSDDEFFVVNATGGVVGASGKATFGAHLPTGPIGPMNGTDILANFGPGGPNTAVFDNAYDAIVLNVVVPHGHKFDLNPPKVPTNMFTILGAFPPEDDALGVFNPSDLFNECESP